VTRGVGDLMGRNLEVEGTLRLGIKECEASRCVRISCFLLRLEIGCDSESQECCSLKKTSA